MTGLDPRSLFEMAARTEPDTTERHLLLIAAIDGALEPDVVLVGGAAVNVHAERRGMELPLDNTAATGGIHTRQYYRIR